MLRLCFGAMTNVLIVIVGSASIVSFATSKAL